MEILYTKEKYGGVIYLIIIIARCFYGYSWIQIKNQKKGLIHSYYKGII